MAHKAYALLNNWEQYNNKTFEFHKERLPWLRWNPLCWGMLLVLGVVGAARLGAESPREARALAAVCQPRAAASMLPLLPSARVSGSRLWPSPPCYGRRRAFGGPGFARAWPTRRRVVLVPLPPRSPGSSAFSGFGGVDDRVDLASRTTSFSPGPPTRSATTPPRSARRTRP